MKNKLEKFYRDFLVLDRNSQNQFPLALGNLFRHNFINRESDGVLYDFVVKNHFVFENFVKFMNYDLIIDSENKVIALIDKEEKLKINLNLQESIMLLVLRLLYEERRYVSERVVISLQEINDKFRDLALENRGLNKTQLKAVFSLFSNHNLIKVLDANIFTGKKRIILYPALLYAVHIDSIDIMYDKLKTYIKRSDSDEEIGKSEID